MFLDLAAPALQLLMLTQMADLRMAVASNNQDAEMPYNKTIPVTLSLSLN